MQSAAPRPLIILNPAAGAGRARRVGGVVRDTLDCLGVRAELVMSARPGDVEVLAGRAAGAGFSPIVVIGGDGTVQAAVNGLLSAAEPPPLGLIPAGTGDDFARSLGIPLGTRRATTLACHGLSRWIDVGRCGERAFVNAAGIGFDAAVAAAAARDPNPRLGRAAYLVRLVSELAHYRPRESVVVIDGRALPRRRVFSVTVANGSSYGGGLRVCPDAASDDGLLDVCIVGDVARREVLGFLPRLAAGRRVQHPAVEYHRAGAVRVEGAAPLPIHLDGEAFVASAVDLSLVPHAVRVIAPPARGSDDVRGSAQAAAPSGRAERAALSVTGSRDGR